MTTVYRRQTRKKEKILFKPAKYYRGLTRRQQIARHKEIEKFGSKGWKDPSAYVGFKTNALRKTRRSSYTAEWDRRFPEAKSLEERSKVTGVPLSFIKQSFNRGMAAWRTGHRPAATEQQWGYARASSFLLCGKTHYTTDSDLVRKAKDISSSARHWWSKTCKNSPVRFGKTG